MKAYYNEHDKNAAAWLRELIKQGVITDGTVDERSIEDVVPAELAEFDRCHFFAGIGVWDYALGQAGWPDDRRVWTGSCPCQPFSAAGKGGGFDDERHLWPAWFHLIEVCRPDTIFGEQVSSKDGTTWLDLVLSDLEGVGYAVGPLDIPAASVGAPHRRQRIYFVGDRRMDHAAAKGLSLRSGKAISRRKARGFDQRPGDACSLALGNAEHEGRDNRSRPQGRRDDHSDRRPAKTRRDGNIGRVRLDVGEDGDSRSTVGDAIGPRLEGFAGNEQNGHQPGRLRADEVRSITSTGSSGEPTNGFWRDAEWIYCRDQKYRPVEPGTFPLVTGAPARVGRLRGYGNAVNAENAVKFIEAAKDILGI